MSFENNNGMDPGKITETSTEVPVEEVKEMSSQAFDEKINAPKAPKSKNKLMIIIGALVILLGGIAFAIPSIKSYMLTKDPVNHILAAMMETSKETSVSSTIIMDGKIDETAPNVEDNFTSVSENPKAFIEYVNALAGNFKVRVDSNVVTDEKNLFNADLKARVQYGDKNFVTLDGSMKPWEMMIQSQDLYSKPMFLDINEVMKKEAGFGLSDFDIPGYVKIVYEKDSLYKQVEGNAKGYYEVVHNLLKDKVEKLPNGTISVYKGDKTDNVKVYNYKLNMKIDEIYDIYSQILEKAKTDENVKKFVLDRADKIIAKVIADKDYEHLGATEEEFKNESENFRKELDTNFAENIDNLIAELKDAQEELKSVTEGNAQNLAYDMTLSIDNDMKLRQYKMVYDAAPVKFAQTITYNSFGSSVKVNSIEKSADSVDLYALASLPQPPKEMIKEIAENLTSKVLSGEAMEALMKDAQEKKSILPEGERDSIANGLQQSVEEMKGSIGFMLMMMGIQ